MSFDLAKVGYEAYGEHAEWKAYDGKPMPRWEELPEHIRIEWAVAARAIAKAALADQKASPF